MKKEGLNDCPLDTWLTAKTFFNGKHGFAISKLVEDNHLINIILTLDQNLLDDANRENLRKNEKNEILRNLHDVNLQLDTSNKNLSNLPKETTVMLERKGEFWIAKLGEPTGLSHSKDKINSSVIYALIKLKRMKEFSEARSVPRTLVRSPILFLDRETYSVIKLFTYDVSSNGVSITLDTDLPSPFEVSKSYTLQLQFAKIYLPPMNYVCKNIREDAITNRKIVGFLLRDDKASDHDVASILTLLSWPE